MLKGLIELNLGAVLTASEGKNKNDDQRQNLDPASIT